MSDKKLPKIKHNHTLTDILKASIFSLVMMAPVTAIGVTCAYVVCNKNAYQSYSNFNANDDRFLKIDSYNLVEGKQYRFISNNEYTNMQSGTTGKMAISNVHVISYTSNFTQYIDGIESSNTLSLWYNPNYSSTFMQFNNANNNFGLNNQYIELTFTFQSYIAVNESNDFRYYFGTGFYEKELINQTNTLDNVFYYAVETMQNNTLFSWTKTTAIYTPVSAMTTGMGITTPAIAVLLVYWLLCTAVYIIIDIVVKGFTWLTHLIGER